MPQCDHLMEIRDCADCRPRTPVPAGSVPQDPSMFGPWFEAAHEGFCPGCGDAIEPGDLIRANGRGGWICRDCGSDEVPYVPGTGHAATLLERFAAGHIDLGKGVR